MKKILIPIDFSKVTNSALIVATEISRKTSAQVTLLHIVDNPSSSGFSTFGQVENRDSMTDLFILKLIEKAKSRIEKILDNVNYVGVKFIPKIKVGNLEKDFTRLINEENPDMIIMGTEGANSLMKGIFNSSHAEEVAMNSNCMVLSVKNADLKFKIKNVVFATNFEEDAPEYLENITYLQDLFFFKLHIVYVDALLGDKKNKDEIEAAKNKLIKEYKIRDYEFSIFKEWTEYAGIITFAEEVKADIIAISTHQGKGLHYFGGIAEDLINFAPQGVLTYKVGTKKKK